MRDYQNTKPSQVDICRVLVNTCNSDSNYSKLPKPLFGVTYKESLYKINELHQGLPSK